MSPASDPNPAMETPKPKTEEIGWMFVQEYYTFLNREPAKLHCFYTKQSTLVHGNETENVPDFKGQKQIHDKFAQLQFVDCKVLVSNVDCQASSDGGILIQVLGEISNQHKPARKFVQTFFLAQQRDGYFVLNDIFRYLKEDTDSNSDANSDIGEDGVVNDAPANGHYHHVQSPMAASTSSVQGTAAQVPQDSFSQSFHREPVPQQQAPVTSQHPEPAELPTPPDTHKPEPFADTRQPAASTNGVSSVPMNAQGPPVAYTHPANTENKPEAPTKSSWANLVAHNSQSATSPTNGMNAQPSFAGAPQPEQERPVSGRPSTNAFLEQPKAAESTPSSEGQTRKPSTPGYQKEENSVFVKNIHGRVAEKALRDALSRLGALEDVRLDRSKGTAYVSFTDPKSVRKALALPDNVLAFGSDQVTIHERRRIQRQSGSARPDRKASDQNTTKRNTTRGNKY